MSSNYAHYASLGSSLPNDYAIVNQFAGHKDDSAVDESSEVDAFSEDDDGRPHVPQHRRTSRNRRPSGQGFTPINGAASYGATGAHRHRRASHGGYEAINQAARSTNYGASPTPAAPGWKAPEREPLLAEMPRIHESYDDQESEAETPAVYRQELKVISKYMAPVFGSHILEYSLSMASVVSIGHLGTTYLAAATLATMTANVTGLSVVQGFVSALDSVLPQAWTTNPQLVGLWSQRMVVLLALLNIPVIIVWCVAEPILLFLKQDPEVARLAGLYLRWLCLGLPAYSMNNVTRRYFQSQGLMHVPTMIIIVVAPLNVFFNWLFVWGPPNVRIGYVGAALASVISLNLITVLTLIYAFLFAPRTAWIRPSASSFKSLGMLLQLGLAGVAQLASEWWSWELVGLAASLLGPLYLACQSVLLVSASSSYQAPFALSVAASVRIGNHLGAGKAMRAKVATYVAVFMSLFVALFFSTIFLVFRHKWAYIFNDDPDVVRLVAQIMPLVALFQIFDATCSVAQGVLRARGRQSLGALLGFIGYYVIGIPFGLLLTFRFGMELEGLWIGLSVALFFNAIVSLWVTFLTDWDHEVERVARRLARDQAELEARKRVDEEVQAALNE